MAKVEFGGWLCTVESMVVLMNQVAVRCGGKEVSLRTVCKNLLNSKR